MIKPITPEDAANGLGAIFPEYVITAINGLLARNVRRFTQNQAISAIISAADAQGIELTREEIFKQKLLDFEPIYRGAGWKVLFDKPGYNESYEANFTFEKK